MNSDAKIEFQHVSFAYGENPPALEDISFQVGEGEFLLIIGHNGAGKSTLLKLLNGINKPSNGTVSVAGHDTRKHPTSFLAQYIAVTFQNPADQLFASSVRKEIEFAPHNLKRKDVHQLVEEALSLFKLDAIASLHPYDLPLAQRKVLTIASSVAAGTSFLAFDEPSAGLSQLENSLLDTALKTLMAQKRGFLVVSHDFELFLPYATRIIVLSQSKLIFDGNSNEVLRQENKLRSAGLKLPTTLRVKKLLEI
ncbi:MAG: ABC transporter ATP-binding protein [Ignavibacteriales bacterium]|nr:ABC transporter ATP-binding protein [Ignavibacteriales bacterium]